MHTPFFIVFALLVVSSAIAQTQESKRAVQTKVEAIVNAPADTAFAYIVPVKLSHIFKRYKNLPAITHTSIDSGWTQAGLVRTVFFEDGSTAREQLLTVHPDSAFSYQIDQFTSQLRLLAKRIEGNWAFTRINDTQTKIEWTYKVVPKNAATRVLIRLMLINKVNGLLNNALTILKNDLESVPSAKK